MSVYVWGSLILAVGGACVFAAYVYGRKAASNESEGCNGHHWDDLTPVENCSRLFKARQKAGLSDDIVENPLKAREAEYHRVTNTIKLVTIGVQSCDDCDEWQTKPMTLKKMDANTFFSVEEE